MPRLRAAHQLFLSYLVLIAAVVAALNIGTDVILRRHLTSSAIEDLRRELLLGRSLYERQTELSPDALADTLGRLSGRRVTVVARDGALLGDSEVREDQLSQVENHLDRPEVQQALAAGIGSSMRLSTTTGTELLYMAARTENGQVIRFAASMDELHTAVGEMQSAIFSVGAVALILAAIFSAGFSLAVTRPLRTIGGVAREMARGNLSRRVRSDRGDELGELAGALDALADELQRRIGQLENERAEVQTLIDSMAEAVLAFDTDGTLRRANPAAHAIFSLAPDAHGLLPEAVARRPDFLALVARALEGETIRPTEVAFNNRHLLASAHPLPAGGAVLVFLDVSELRRLEGVRRDFVANASHELKTPLTAIRGYSETLLDEELPAGLRRQFAETVRTNAERLQRIVDDLLDLSRLEAGAWQVQTERVAIEEVARDAWAAVDSHSGGKRIRFSVQIEPASGYVAADASALRQIFINLFSNACRYTPAGGEITLHARRVSSGPDLPEQGRVEPQRQWRAAREVRSQQPRVLIEVTDTGSGIPSQHLPRIFERFYRVDPARSRIEGGTGLGLAIVKHLVEAHGGEIEAESELGHGTTIRFTFPYG